MLKSRFPAAEVFKSCDKDFVCVRSVIGQSNFGKNGAGEQVIVPITDTKKYHIDTIRYRIMNPLFNWDEWKWTNKPTL